MSAPRLRAPDTGSATVWGLMLCFLLMAAGAVLVLVAQVAVARHRVAAAADLSALAAASRPFEPAGACALAARVAAASDAQLRSCRVGGDVADVRVEVPLRGWLAQLPPAQARARAGPGGGVVPSLPSGFPSARPGRDR